MAEIKKIYEDAARTQEIYPLTHEKSVIDDNGTPLNSKLGMITDLVNQKQMAVGSVPSDLAPMRGSSNWVTSDGISAYTAYYKDANLGNATYPSTIINGSGVWATVTGASSILIPVSAGQQFKVVGNGNITGTLYAFVKSNVTTAGQSVQFATGYTGRMSESGSATFYITAPSDATYLWFMFQNSSGSMMPTLFVPQNIVNLKEDTSVYDNIKIDLSTCPESHRAIKGNALWVITEPDAFSVLLPVNVGEVYDIIAGEQICLYSLLTDADIDAVQNTPPSFVSGYNGRITVNAHTSATITIPSTCKYICFISYSADRTVCFLPELYLHGSSNIKKGVEKNYSMSESMYGIDLSLYYTYNRVITGDGHWLCDSAFESKALPVNEGDVLTIIGNKDGVTYYAFLTSTDNACETGDTPSFVTGYTKRYGVNAGGMRNAIIPSGCKYLFILTDNIPEIYVNNKALIELVNKEKSSYSLVYNEDFDNGIDTNFWRPIEMSWNYASRCYADNKNWYADSSCMVLKLENRNGTYYAPYISTAKTFAINKGKIEVRVKCNVTNTNLGWCFWTFGQNAPWPAALEIDLYEKIVGDDTQYVHYHYVDTNNENVDLKPTSVTSSAFGNDWHTLGVEWGGNVLITYYDGVQTSITTLSDSKYPITYPQQLCFNIKCNSQYSGGDAYLFVDYVKVWVAKEESPITSFEQNDLSLSVGESTYINPTFVPSNCINKAFTLTSNNASVVSVQEYEGGYENHYLQRKITAVSAGTATLTITAANGSVTKTFTVTVS
jgi:hypothetical protein